jgi:hypothetical protein
VDHELDLSQPARRAVAASCLGACVSALLLLLYALAGVVEPSLRVIWLDPYALGLSVVLAIASSVVITVWRTMMPADVRITDFQWRYVTVPTLGVGLITPVACILLMCEIV